MVRIPLLEALESHIQNRPISLHVPGHKSGKGLHPSIGTWLGAAAKLDLTELPDLDDLHHPTGAIEEAQSLAAKAFGADRSYFLVNGSTGGNYAMMLTACRPGDSVFVVRDCHISAIRGLQLSGATPIYLPTEFDPDGYPIGLSPEVLQEAIQLHPQTRALFLTSPSYRGACSKLEELIEVAHAANLLVLVDEAHGAHFAFHPDLPRPAIHCGADLVVQSTHKTVGSLTQSAMLHVRGCRVSYTRLESKLRLVQSSSPSYLLLVSLDAARAQMQTIGTSRLQEVLTGLRKWIVQFENGNGLRILSGQSTLTPDSVIRDPLRWWVDCRRVATGFEAARWLQEKRIFVEFADPAGFLIVWSFADSEKTIERVVKLLLEMTVVFQNRVSKRDSKAPSEQESFIRHLSACAVPEVVLSPAEAEEAQSERVSVRELPGRLAGEAIVPYPPGIPVMLPGERWTSELRDAIQAYVRAGGKLQGASCSDFTDALVLVEN